MKKQKRGGVKAPPIHRVAFTLLRNAMEVSTVLLPKDNALFQAFDQSQEHNDPYETAVFKPGTRDAVDMNHYVTKEAALVGHEEMVKKWQPKDDVQ